MKQNTDDKKIEGHVYDGIEELDYGPPLWFQALFYVTLLFGAAYWVYYSVGGGPTLIDEYHQAQSLDEMANLNRIAKDNNQMPSESELNAFVSNPEKKKAGKSIYQAKCVSCHGVDAQGGIGPNLTDEYWLHGGKLTEIIGTISKGVADKGMPPWGSMMSRDELVEVAVYIRSLAGSNPPGAKAPQGTIIK